MTDTKKLLLIAAVVVVLVVVLLVGGRSGSVPIPGRFDLSTQTPAPTQIVPQDSREVVIENYNYLPANLVIKAGDTITWKNNDTVAHTATADDGTFDTGMIEPGQEKSIAFNTPGTYPYYCLPHPDMRGTIIVE